MSDMMRVPRNAMHFAVDLEIGDNGEDSKSAPITMRARSGESVNHPFWGEVVHDLDGMQLHKSRLPIDYAHSNEVLGYLNNFSTDTGDLIVSGALTPFQGQDRTSEVIHKMRQGVPYEASINFAGGRPKVEKVPEGTVVTVNGREFTGPLTVIREWSLRGVAVVPYGADMNTSAMAFSADTETLDVEVIEMTTETLAAEEEVTTESVEAETAEETQTETESVVEEVQAEETVEAATAVEETATEMSEGQRFLAAFGERGGVWFAQGLSYDEAMQKHVAELQAENESLRARLAEAADTNDGSVEFSVPGNPRPDAKKFAQQGVPRSAAAFAAAFEMRQQQRQG